MEIGGLGGGEGGGGLGGDWKLEINDEKVFKKLKEIDEHIVQEALKNQKEWFGGKKEFTIQELREKYKGGIRKSESNENEIYAQIKVSCPGEKRPTPIQLINEDGKTTRPGTIDDLRRSAGVVPIVRIYNIWFMNTSFGITLHADKLLVRPVKKLEFLDSFNLDSPLEWTDNLS